jgi:hypothetical protein
MAAPGRAGGRTLLRRQGGGGGRFRDEELHLYTLDEDGKVARMRHYVDTAKHVAASRGGHDTELTEDAWLASVVRGLTLREPASGWLLTRA